MSIIDAPSARTLVAGDLVAVFLPAHGMLGASLAHRGVELLRRVDDLDGAAAAGTTAGIPLLHPWANRLAGDRYRAAGRPVVLERSSPLVHRDANGLPIHGVPWSRLAWAVIEARQDRIAAALEWTRADLLAVFPFRHRIELEATLDPEGLLLATTIIASDRDTRAGELRIPSLSRDSRVAPERMATATARDEPAGRRCARDSGRKLGTVRGARCAARR